MLTYYESFNRADENPLAGDWNTVPGWNALKIVSNQVVGSVALGECGSYLATGQGGPDQFCEIILGNTSPDCGPCLCIQPTAQVNCYEYDPSGDQISKFVNGAFFNIDTFAITWVTGDRCRFSIVGSLLSVYQNGVLMRSITDATFRGGAVGLYAFDNNFNSIEGVMCGYYDAVSTGV